MMSNPPSALGEVKDFLAILDLVSSDFGLNLSFPLLLQTLNSIPKQKHNSQGFRVLAKHFSDLQQLITTLSPGIVKSLHLLPTLDREIKNLHSAVIEAMSQRKIDHFLDSLNDVESIAAHNDKICQAIQSLGEEVNAFTNKPQKPESVYSGMTIVQQDAGSSVQEGMARMRAELPRNPGRGIFFNNVKINTTRSDGQQGGSVCSKNVGFPTMNFREVRITTGGGSFVEDNELSQVGASQKKIDHGIFFHKADINTAGPSGQPGGGVFNRNKGFPTLSLDDVEMETGGGGFGEDNDYSPEFSQIRPRPSILESRTSSGAQR